jgi:hypothetical protein
VAGAAGKVQAGSVPRRTSGKQANITAVHPQDNAPGAILNTVITK